MSNLRTQAHNLKEDVFHPTHPNKEGKQMEGQEREGQREGQQWEGQPREGQQREGQQWEGQQREGQRMEGQRMEGQRMEGQQREGQQWEGQQREGQRMEGQRMEGQSMPQNQGQYGPSGQNQGQYGQSDQYGQSGPYGQTGLNQVPSGQNQEQDRRQEQYGQSGQNQEQDRRQDQSSQQPTQGQQESSGGHPGLTPRGTFAIKSLTSNLYMSLPQGEVSKVIMQDKIGDWEKINIQPTGQGYTVWLGLKNGSFLSANRSVASTTMRKDKTEEFTVNLNNDNTYSFRSYDGNFLRAHKDGRLDFTNIFRDSAKFTLQEQAVV